MSQAKFKKYDEKLIALIRETGSIAKASKILILREEELTINDYKALLNRAYKIRINPLRKTTQAELMANKYFCSECLEKNYCDKAACKYEEDFNSYGWELREKKVVIDEGVTDAAEN